MGDLEVDIVDENDVVIGRSSIHKVQSEGRRHRIVRISLEDPAGNVLIQRRQDHKELYPGRWDSAAAGHVDTGETYQIAAERELKEELGVVTQLHKVKYYPSEGKFGWRILKRFNTLYKGLISRDTTFELQTDEVAEVRWVSVAELRDLVVNHPDSLADGLIEVYESMYTS